MMKSFIYTSAYLFLTLILSGCGGESPSSSSIDKTRVIQQKASKIELSKNVESIEKLDISLLNPALSVPVPVPVPETKVGNDLEANQVNASNIEASILIRVRGSSLVFDQNRWDEGTWQ